MIHKNPLLCWILYFWYYILINCTNVSATLQYRAAINILPKKYGWMILILIQYFPILNLSIYLVSVKKIFKSRIFIKSLFFSKVNFFQKSVFFFKRQYLFMSHNFFKSQFFKVIFIQNKFIEKIHLKKIQYLKTF